MSTWPVSGVESRTRIEYRAIGRYIDGDPEFLTAPERLRIDDADEDAARMTQADEIYIQFRRVTLSEWQNVETQRRSTME